MTRYHLINGERVAFTAEEETARDAEEAAWAAEIAATGYIQLRRKAYPSFESQLDYIYHNGIDKWKTDIVDPVKAKYPKPS
tara:strand:+ start:755 stop:997 length:243 start_codon:yes stop_codon:yes gene_type:complete